ncbi:hypothetical protein, partial [uncultured Algoriphagus sp.]|uniref:hypothetical protein n=1 Tax=uncultured Algoriphagus sp. TaxID=417365 RepID=UPI0025998E1D
MEVIESTLKEFGNIFPNAFHVFGSAEFNHLNAAKVDEVFYLIFKDSKHRLGLVVGILDGIVKSPFSAPIGGFVFLNEEVKIHQIDGAVEALIQWVEKKRFNGIEITLPPSIYHPSFIAKQLNAFYRAGF